MKKTSSKRASHKVSKRLGDDFRFDARALVRAARRAVREALLQHKRAGNPVAGVVKGEIVLIPPARIKV